MYHIAKIAITTGLIILISEIAKRSTLLGAFLASIPLVSVLAMVWLFIETKDVSKVSELSTSVFWLVIPSLTLFLTLPILLRNNVNFYLSLSVSLLITALSYWSMIVILSKFGVRL